MRVIGTELSAPTIDAKRLEDREIVRVRLKLMTPMIGGGTKAGEVDSIWPIRASSVRGHLRWWWRASCGALYETLEEMVKAEERIWGAGEVWGAVKVSVNVVNAGQRGDVQCPPYAKGPLGIGGNLQGLKGCVFDVALSLNLPQAVSKEEVHDIEQALRLWVLYGGIGARTRRGFGSLMPADSSAVKALKDIGDYSYGDGAKCAKGKFSHLHGCALLLSSVGNEQAAWTKAIESYMHFRRGELPGRPRPPKGPGSHSPWPEADMMRLLHNAQKMDKPSRSGSPYNLPRAQLGLPLTLRSMPQHFGSFRNTTIQGRDKERSRLASLAICKPVWTPDGIKAGVLLLVQPQLGPHSVTVGGKNVEIKCDATDGPPVFANGVLEKSIRASLRNYLITHCQFKKQEGRL